MKRQFVYVVTAWDERKGRDTIMVFSRKVDADRAWRRLDGPHVYISLARRTIRS